MADLKALMARIYDDIFTNGNLDLIDELLHENFVEHEELPPGIPPGREAPRAYMNLMRSAFPDFRADIQEMLQDGNKVITRAQFSGTHEGEFMGIPATGNKFAVTAVDIVEFEGDKAIGHWGVTDMAGMMRQLGVGGDATG